MAVLSMQDIQKMDFEGGRLTLADFNDGKDEGSTISAQTVAEVATAEIGEDGQLTSYNAVRLGRPLDPTGRSAKGKLFANIKNTSNSDVDDRTEVRLVVRPKNGNRRTPLTDWYSENELNQSSTQDRIPLSPVTNAQGQPLVGGEGRILAVEARNPATSFEFGRSNSQLRVPAIFGY